jgi:DNA-directed RNA polymerase specialized sigma24 family protein
MARMAQTDVLSGRAGCRQLTEKAIAAQDQQWRWHTVPLTPDMADARPYCLVLECEDVTKLARWCNAALDDAHTAVIVHWYNRSTYREIAMQLDISPGVAGRRFRHACAVLRAYVSTDPYRDLAEVLRAVFTLRVLRLAGY